MAEQTWPACAADELGAGTAQGRVVAATGDMSPDDWGLATDVQLRAVFPLGPAPARAPTDAASRVNLSLRSHLGRPHHGVRGPARRQSTWLEYVQAHPFPREVRRSWISVQADALVDTESDNLLVFVGPSDGTRAVAVRISEHHCTSSAHRNLSVSVRSYARSPERLSTAGDVRSAVGDPTSALDSPRPDSHPWRRAPSTPTNSVSAPLSTVWNSSPEQFPDS